MEKRIYLFLDGNGVHLKTFQDDAELTAEEKAEEHAGSSMNWQELDAGELPVIVENILQVQDELTGK